MLIGQNVKNLLINGNFDIWQRNTSFTSPGQFTYLADRWYNGSGANTSAVVSVQTENPTNGKYALQWLAGSTGSQMNINQAIESVNMPQILGKYVTFSVYIKKNSGNARSYTLAIAKSASADAINVTWTTIASLNIPNASISSTQYNRFSVSVLVPNDGSANGLRVFLMDNATGSATDYLNMSSAMLSVGQELIDFESAGKSPAEELTLCRRYCEKFLGVGAYPVDMSGSTTIGGAYAQFLVEKRTIPTLVIGSSLVANSRYYGPSGIRGINSIVVTSSSTRQIGLEITLASAVTQYTDGIWKVISNGANDYFIADSEL